MSVAISMQDISKKYGSLVANDSINLSVNRGDIHVILGENGAGKSTLMRILFGEEQADAGQIYIKNELIEAHNPAIALSKGIGLVHQHDVLVDEFTVLQNFSLGSEPTKYGFIANHDSIRRKAEKVLAQLEIDISLDTLVGNLTLEEKKLIEIGQAIFRNTDILILDEPTSVLSPQKIDKLFDILKILQSEGKTILLITHRLAEVFIIADAITVLRKGKLVRTCSVQEINEENIVRMMVGHDDIKPLLKFSKLPEGEPCLRVADLTVIENQRHILSDINLTIAKGEILGITGIGGNGQLELAETICGLIPITEGEIFLANHNITDLDVKERRRLGLCYIPEDRVNKGLATELSLHDNLIMGHHSLRIFGKTINLNRKATNTFCQSLIKKYSIKADHITQKAASLSGGNLQKIIVARELEFEGQLIVASYPTQGIDIVNTNFVRNELLKKKNEGYSILLISGDLDEILALSDRIGVMYRGKLVAIKESSNLDRYDIGRWMTGFQTHDDKDSFKARKQSDEN